MGIVARILILAALPAPALASCVYTGAKRAYLDCVYAQVESTTSELASMAASLLSLDTRVTELETDVVNVQADVVNLEADVTTVEASVTGLEADVSLLDVGLNTLADALDLVFTALDDLTAQVGFLDSDVTALAGDVAQLEADVAALGSGGGGGGGAGTSGPAWVQLVGPAQTFANDTWTPVLFNSTTVANNVRAVGRTLYFDHVGTYRITLSYRNGIGPDTWTATRLFGGGQARGLSVAGANLLNSTELTTWEFLATVSDTNVGYEVQVGRAGGSLAVAQPVDVVGQTLPAVQATVHRLGDLGTEDAAQFEGPGQTFAGGAWTPVVLNGASVADNGWTLASNGTDIRFPSAGIWRVTLSYRWGTGTDNWTAVRVFGNGSSRGQSAGTGQHTNSSELGTFDFLVDITDASVNYQLQLGRQANNQAVTASPTLAGGVYMPAVQATFAKIAASKGAAQFEGPAVTWPSNAWTAVNFSGTPVSANGVSVSGTNITLPRAGTYRVTLSYRNGTGADVWTGVRLHGDGATRGVSAGTGNALNSPDLFTYSFLATITNPAVSYQIQYGRLAGSTAVATTIGIAGQTPPAVQATIEEL